MNYYQQMNLSVHISHNAKRLLKILNLRLISKHNFMIFPKAPSFSFHALIVSLNISHEVKPFKNEQKF